MSEYYHIPAAVDCNSPVFGAESERGGHLLCRSLNEQLNPNGGFEWVNPATNRTMSRRIAYPITEAEARAIIADKLTTDGQLTR